MEYNVFGGGLFGVLLAQKMARLLAKSRVKGIVNLHERSSAIIPSWSSITVGNLGFNKGFYGIEMPRAKGLIDEFHPHLEMKLFCRLNNFKLLMINDYLIPFREPLKYWPAGLIEGLPDILKKYQNKTSHLPAGVFQGTELFRVLSKIYLRYSNNIDYCWHLLYPWFFPSEFQFDNADEGLAFQQKASRGQGFTYYLVPQKGLFSDLRQRVLLSVRDSGVNLYHNSTREVTSASDSSQNIWAASCVPLARLLDCKLTESLSSGERYLSISIFRTRNTSVKRLDLQSALFPSEVLIADEQCIELSRLSFTRRPHLNVNCTDLFIIAEAYFKSPKIPTLCLSNMRSVISRLLGTSEIEHLYSSDMQRFDVIRPSSVPAVQSELISLTKANDVLIPYPYWWPINMAKCISAAHSAAEAVIS